MDLGATICTPHKPTCSLCPINQECLAYRNGTPLDFPVKIPKKAKPTRIGAAYVVQRSDGAIWLIKRVASGLLGAMAAVPSTRWTASQDGETGCRAAPVKADWLNCGKIRHTFTHFHLELEVWRGQVEEIDGDGWWSTPGEIAGEALPTVMKKVIATAGEISNSTS